MSRVGKMQIAIPEGTTASIEGSKVTVKGKQGTLVRVFSDLVPSSRKVMY